MVGVSGKGKRRRVEREKKKIICQYNSFGMFPVLSVRAEVGGEGGGRVKRHKETRTMSSVPSDVKSVCERQIRCDAFVGSILVVGQLSAISTKCTHSSTTS